MKCNLAKFITLLGIVTVVAIAVHAQEIPTYSLKQFVVEGLEKDGYLVEKRYGKKLKELAIDEIKMGVILPRFEMTAGWGPAPGLRTTIDNEKYSGGSIDGKPFESLLLPTSKTEYDLSTFSNWGPAFVTEVKMVQPLNVFRYNSGVAAAEADKSLYNWETKGLEVEKSRELQEYYYGYLYALEMHKLAKEVEKEIDKIEEKVEELLDEFDESVSQFDLLELKTNRYAVDEGVEESRLGLKRAKLAAAFSLGLDNGDSFKFIDTVLVERTDIVPHLDSLKNILIQSHPDLKKLHFGLNAKKSLTQLAAGELGPEIFLFASANYAKSWAGDRRNFSNEAFTEDPLNNVSGTVGLGIKYHLNIWSKYQKYRKKKLEYSHLQRKEYYAERGLLLLLEEQYDKYAKSERLLKSARKSLRAAEAWFKGAAMKYDVDPSESKGLLSAFKAKMNAKKIFIESVYNYNLAIGSLYEKCGWSILDYYSSLE